MPSTQGVDDPVYRASLRRDPHTGRMRTEAEITSLITGEPVASDTPDNTPSEGNSGDTSVDPNASGEGSGADTSVGPDNSIIMSPSTMSPSGPSMLSNLGINPSPTGGSSAGAGQIGPGAQTAGGGGQMPAMPTFGAGGSMSGIHSGGMAPGTITSMTSNPGSGASFNASSAADAYTKSTNQANRANKQMLAAIMKSVNESLKNVKGSRNTELALANENAGKQQGALMDQAAGSGMPVSVSSSLQAGLQRNQAMAQAQIKQLARQDREGILSQKRGYLQNVTNSAPNTAALMSFINQGSQAAGQSGGRIY